MTLESNADVWMDLKVEGGGYFGGWLPATTGAQTRTLAFATLTPDANSTTSTLDLAEVTDIQFSAKAPAQGFGFAIHEVDLY